MFVYSNGGASFRNCAPDYVLQTGEKVLPEGATAAQIAAAFPAYSQPEPAQPPPTQVAAALNVKIANGDIPDAGGLSNIAAVIYMDVGIYWVLFSADQPDANYHTVISGGAPVMSTDGEDTSSFMITACDAVGGNHVDPAGFSVQVYRV